MLDLFTGRLNHINVANAAITAAKAKKVRYPELLRKLL